MYIIVRNETDPFTGKPCFNYLGWQEPAWDDDGYFWTSKETINDMLKEQSNGGFKYNTKDHPFLFDTKEATSNYARKIKLGYYGRYHIIEWN